MALTPLRWLIVATAACAIIWVGLLRGVSSVDRPAVDDIAARVRASAAPPAPDRVLEGKVAAANERRRTLELRDSVLRTVATSSPNGLSVEIDSRFPANIRASLDSSLHRQWLALGASPSRETVVAVVIDTARSSHGLPRQRRFPGGIPIETFRPSAETGGRCVSIAHVAWIPAFEAPLLRLLLRNLMTTETTQALLGSCAFLAAFGEPGPHVEQWLLETHWQPARLAAWNRAAEPQSELEVPGRMMSFIDDIVASSDASWQLRHSVAPTGIACLGGEAGACEQAMLGGHLPPRDTAWNAHVISSSGTSAQGFFLPPPATNLGPDEGTLVSEMVRALGPTRFAQFWTSAQPVAEAFKSASGGDVDSWTRNWARRMYGSTSIGPSLSGRGVMTGSVALLLGLALAIGAGRRRRVA